MTQLVAVDGTYELFRSYFAAPSRRDQDGREVGATLACARSLWKLRQSGEFDYMAVSFDSVVESFRNELFAGYKTGEGLASDLLAQFPLIETLCNALGLCVLSMVEFEADDGLHAVVRQFENEAVLSRLVIASPDKDLCQSVRGQRVVTWDRMRDRYYDEQGVWEKLGVAPASVPDYLALVGDSADGIPGVPRWGAKSAAKILARYAHVEAIPADPSQWEVTLRGKVALAEQLQLSAQQLPLYRSLATLRDDAPVPRTLAELEPRRPDHETLSELAERWRSRWLADFCKGEANS